MTGTAELLGRDRERAPGPAVDGGPVTVEARHSDITRIPPGELSDAALITASALLDMLTEAALDAVVSVCAGVGCPVLITLSVVGHVELTPGRSA